MSSNIILDKSVAFALRIVGLYKFLSKEQQEYVLSKQILLSGTFVAKFVKTANQSQNRSEFISNMQIALQRASETEFWLFILKEGEYLDEKQFESLNKDCTELIKILTSILKSSKTNV